MTYELPKTILERFLSKKFVILGRAGLDLYPNPIGLSTQDADNFISDLGGSAANIAVSMSKLGCNTFLCSTFSDDSVGDFIKKKLQEYLDPNAVEESTPAAGSETTPESSSPQKTDFTLETATAGNKDTVSKFDDLFNE